MQNTTTKCTCWNLKHIGCSGRTSLLPATLEDWKTFPCLMCNDVCCYFDLVKIWQEHREHMDPFCLVAPGCWWSKDVEDFFFLAHVAQCCINTTVWQLLLTMSVPLWPQFSRTVNRSAKPRIITSWFTVHCAEMASTVSRCQSNRTFGMWGNTVVFDRRVCNIWVTSSSSCVLFLAPSRISSSHTDRPWFYMMQVVVTVCCIREDEEKFEDCESWYLGLTQYIAN